MKRTIVTLSVLGLLAAACGVGDVGNAGPVTLAPSGTEATTSTTAPGGEPSVTTLPPDDSTPAGQAFVELFFVKEGVSAQAVLRAVDKPEVAANAIRALIEGPTPAEQDTELGSAIPADTLLLGLTIDNGLATIDLSREFEVGGGSFNILSRLAQVVYTLTQFPTVDEVLFYLDGKPVEVFSGEGVVLEDPVDRSDYYSILPTEPGRGFVAGTTWKQTDLPAVTGVDPARLSRVTLVSSGDVLNVRQDPDPAAPIVGKLLPGVIVIRTGPEEVRGSSIWVQIETPVGRFWVNSWFLGEFVPAQDFARDPRVGALLQEFADIIAGDGDLRAVTSRRGLYVAYNAEPVRFTPEQLASILTDQKTYQWRSNAMAADDPEFLAIPGRTFAEAVADSFLSAFRDSDTMTTVNDPVEAGNSRLPEYAIPVEFASFNYIGVHDPGDNPDYGGLDWITWYVAFDYEGGSPVIVGMTVDMWTP